jgi:hypothetical protein
MPSKSVSTMAERQGAFLTPCHVGGLGLVLRREAHPNHLICCAYQRTDNSRSATVLSTVALLELWLSNSLRDGHCRGIKHLLTLWATRKVSPALCVYTVVPGIVFSRCIGNTYNAGIQLANPTWTEKGQPVGCWKNGIHLSEPDVSAEQIAAEKAFPNLWCVKTCSIWLWDGVRC